MSAGESAVLRSAKPHVGKENAMLPPLAAPNRVLSIAKHPKYANPKTGIARRPNSDEDRKSLKATSPNRGEATSPSQNPQEQRRILELEKSMLFMKEHHEKILLKLHEEIEELKQKNRQLNFRLVMSPASLPAHLLSPEEDQPPGQGSPRHQPQPATTTPARQPPLQQQQGVTVQLELLEGELAELRCSLEAERSRCAQLVEDLEKAKSQRIGESAVYRPPPGLVGDLEQRLAAAENHARQLKRERDDAQRAITRMRSSIQYRPPWRAGGQQRQPPSSPQAKSPPARQATASQQLPKIPPQTGRGSAHRPETRGSTAPARPLESRTSSPGSLPALPRGRSSRQPPPPPPRPTKP